MLFKAFNEESFSHRGEHFTIPPEVEYRGYDLEEVTLVPRPKNLPVEMWQPIVSGRTIDFIAKTPYQRCCRTDWRVAREGTSLNSIATPTRSTVASFSLEKTSP